MLEFRVCGLGGLGLAVWGVWVWGLGFRLSQEAGNGNAMMGAGDPTKLTLASALPVLSPSFFFFSGPLLQPYQPSTALRYFLSPHIRLTSALCMEYCFRFTVHDRS